MLLPHDTAQWHVITGALLAVLACGAVCRVVKGACLWYCLCHHAHVLHITFTGFFRRLLVPFRDVVCTNSGLWLLIALEPVAGLCCRENRKCLTHCQYHHWPNVWHSMIFSQGLAEDLLRTGPAHSGGAPPLKLTGMQAR